MVLGKTPSLRFDISAYEIATINPKNKGITRTYTSCACASAMHAHTHLSCASAMHACTYTSLMWECHTCMSIHNQVQIKKECSLPIDIPSWVTKLTIIVFYLEGKNHLKIHYLLHVSLAYHSIL